MPVQAILVKSLYADGQWMKKNAPDATYFDEKTHTLICRGDWDLPHIPQLKELLSSVNWPQEGDVIFNGADIQKMDSAGAWLIAEWGEILKERGLTVKREHFSEEREKLFEIVVDTVKEEKPLPEVKEPGFLAVLGRNTTNGLLYFHDYLSFVGHLTMEALRIGWRPHRWRWNSLASVVYATGYQALPIIALLSILIGVVITYQMGLQLKNYGANIYIVDLLGLSVLREFGPLITAIMVAGRTGSAFTAQLGMMKLNQEIDALNTMGVTPAELLLLPRIIGLFIALPLLTMWADIFGVLGGMVTSSKMLGISWYDFLHRFPRVIPLRALLIGVGKAPVFALIIASIGCFQGMKVEMSADSVGFNTTKSVVLSIFFIIVADAIFSVIFSELKL